MQGAGRRCAGTAAAGARVPDLSFYKKQVRADMQEPDMITEIAVFDPDVEGQQIEFVYTQSAVAMLAALTLACLVAVSLWAVADHSHLTLWLVAQAAQTLVRLGIVLGYRRASEHERSSPKWMLLFFIGALMAGIIWGSLGLLFSFSWPVEYQTLTLLSMAGIVSGAIPTYAAVMSIYIAFMVPCILIPAQSMLIYNSSLQSNLGLILMLFAGVLVMIARNYNKSITKSLQLRMENQSLIASMRSARA